MFQGRKGFWKPPPQIWLGDVNKIRVLDPHFLHQTADRLLRIPLYPKSRQVRDQFPQAAGSEIATLEPDVLFRAHIESLPCP